VRTRLLGAPGDDLVEGLVDRDAESPHGRVQRLTHAQSVEGKHSARVRRPPAERAVASDIHGEETTGVRRDQGARGEVGADGQQLLAGRSQRGIREFPVAVRQRDHAQPIRAEGS